MFGISLFGVHLAGITIIDVGKMWEVIADALRRKKAAWIGVSDYAKALSNIITKQIDDGTLYVSVGTGDFLTSWITRICAESGTNAKGLTIKHIVVKHIDLKLARSLENLGVLEPNFVDKLQMNIEALRSDHALRNYNIIMNFKTWSTMPLFHGYLFGDEFLIGYWQVGQGGQFHVRTPLFKSSASKLPNVHDFMKLKFEEG